MKSCPGVKTLQILPHSLETGLAGCRIGLPASSRRFGSGPFSVYRQDCPPLAGLADYPPARGEVFRKWQTLEENLKALVLRLWLDRPRKGESPPGGQA